MATEAALSAERGAKKTVGEYANPEALVSTEWVAGHLDDGTFKLIEVDEDTDAYEKAHIPGANSLHWRNELQDPVVRNFADKGQFEKLLGKKGVANDELVVLYGGNNNWFSAYAYWYFKVYGHDNVKLMNGGRKKWELEGRELTSEKPSVSTTNYQAKEADPSIRALRDEVIAGVGTTPMVDVRSPDEFSGKLAAPAHLPQEQAQRKGHIPGAKNVPWSKSANEDGTFKTLEELKTLYQVEQGLEPQNETIAYCRIGERSSHTWFVLKELLGFPKVKNYDGSWTEYGSLVGVPIALDYKEEAGN
jgi:thiosulfate/3-mercaptopyruvate sulfurtransferase